MDAWANLAVGTIATAPAPSSSGVSLTLTAGHGARFPAAPFNATVWPANTLPDPANAEIVRVTAVTGDVLTIVRAQEGIPAVAAAVGYQVAATVTKKTLDDVMFAVADPGFSAPLAYRPIRAALASSGTARAKIVVMGDSNDEGQGQASDSLRWVGQLQTALRRRYGVTGGTGYKPVYYESAITQPAVTALGAAPGTLTKDIRYGLGGRTYQVAKTATVTYTQTCTGFTVHYAKDSFAVNLVVKVDTVAQTPINCNGTAAGGFTQLYSGFTNASHVVELSCSDLSGGFIAVPSGVDFYVNDSATGIGVYDASHFGWASDNHTAEILKSVTAVAPQCVVIAVGTNDCLLYSAATYQTKLGQLLARVRAAVTGQCTVIFLMKPERADAGIIEPWANYILAARAVAATDTYATVIDLGEHMGKIASNPLTLFADQVHLNVAGGAYAGADVLFAALTNAT